MGVGSDALRRGLLRARDSFSSDEAIDDARGPAAPMRSGSDSVWIILAVAAVVLVGVGLRFFARSDLWADEVLTVNISGLPLSQLRGALKQDGAPPLYYLLLHFWMRAFGTGNETVRALSGVFGVAALVPAWFAGRRLDRRRAREGLADPSSRTVAWATVLLLAASPFAIRYSTETRMYSLVMLLVFLGYLALARVFDRPSLGRLACLAIVTALLLYTHYWSFALLAVVGLWVLYLAVWGPLGRRRSARCALGALVVGALSFVPWLSTFRYQEVHTGTPWGAVVSPVSSTAEAVKSFGGNTHIVGWALLFLFLLAVFARGIDKRHIDVDLWTRPGVRIEAGLGLVTLGLGLLLARATSTTFEGRYASVMFPLFLLAAGFGVTVFASRAVRYTVIALLLVGGFWGGASNALRSRTQAFEIANAIEHEGHPGDLVVYCPDSIGTDVNRLLPSDVHQVALPGFTSPGRIDWVDYTKRVDAMRPSDTAAEILRRAGDHSVLFVYTSGTQPLQTKCGLIADTLSLSRPRVRSIEPDLYFFENQGLYEFPARPR
jgi:hypothetical protein